MTKRFILSLPLSIAFLLSGCSTMTINRDDVPNVCRGKNWLDAPVIAVKLAKSSDPDDQESGIGGTGHDTNHHSEIMANRHLDIEDGIGGTGHSGVNRVDEIIAKQKRDIDDGIGGTGNKTLNDTDVIAKNRAEVDDGIGGTGIIGMIAGFGSLCIAGQEVFYDQSTPVTVNGQSVDNPAFGLGQMVAVRATAVENGYVATEIQLLQEVRGQLQNLSEDGQSFDVLGQKVQIAEALPTNLEGQSVAISGYRLANGNIQATRIETTHHQLESFIGQVDVVNGQHIMVAGQNVSLIETQTLPEVGSEIRVTGHSVSGEFIVDSWQANPRMAFSLPVERVMFADHVRGWQHQGMMFDHASSRRELHQDYHQEHDHPTMVRDAIVSQEVMRPEIPHIDHDHIDIIRQDRFDLWREPPHRPDLPEHPPERPKDN